MTHFLERYKILMIYCCLINSQNSDDLNHTFHKLQYLQVNYRLFFDLINNANWAQSFYKSHHISLIKAIILKSGVFIQ